VETLKAVFADRAQYLGDPDFSAIPVNELLSSDHIAAIRGRLSAVRTVPAAAYDRALASGDGGTSHISVVDAAGNAVALTTSINTAFGAKVGVPGRGIVLNNTMDDFSVQPGKPNVYGLVGTAANAIVPGKRPLSSMSPTIVLESDGDVRAVAGASGGPLIISSTLQAILNLLEFDMSVEDAVDSARVHHQWLPDRTFVEGALPELVRMGLARIGHDVRALESKAAVQLIDVRAEHNRRTVSACSDGRKGGIAAAY
jgi:gamma-glutamyltranspeptidase/glutathione hydrolase